MPDSCSGAQRALRRIPTPRVTAHLRSARPWFAALSLALVVPLAPSPISQPLSTQAAGQCGRWASRTTPPDSIRVLRTATGTVEEVHFATYVATVMASGEWPTWLPREALKVGATAAKQYAWYYLLRGHHRSAYRTRDGTCYDVRDDTNDQLYRPETARPTQKQLDALADTWALSLRKGNRFFLTGYRAGDDVGCARDRDGWRIYAKSMEACARQGWSRQRIQATYYAPKVRFVWDVAGKDDPAGTGTDRRAPLIIAPQVRLAVGGTVGGEMGLVTWGGGDSGSGILNYRLQQRIDGGAWTTVRLASRSATHARVPLGVGQSHQFRVRARDRARNVSEWAMAVGVRPEVRETGVARMKGDWDLIRQRSATEGSLRRADRRGERLSLTFRGRAVGIVAPTGGRRGQMQVRVAGKVMAIVDLRRRPAGPRRVVWTRAWHTTRVRKVGVIVMGTRGRPRVEIDAFVVLH